jgi:hypothetical protein
MKLFNKTIDRQLFKQYALGSDLSKQEAVVKIFNPVANGTWFILNSDPQDPDYLWAIVDLGYGAEVGSVSRSDLETYRGKFGMGFERDLSFDPVNAEELYKGLRQGKFYADGGEVSFIDYKDSEIIYEPHNKKYYANDVEFDSLKEAQDFIDSGEVSADIRDAYSKGLFADGGLITEDKLKEKEWFSPDMKIMYQYKNGRLGITLFYGKNRRYSKIAVINNASELSIKELNLRVKKEIAELKQFAKEILENNFADGGNLSRDRKFVNYSQDYEVRYSKGTNRKGYGFADGGEMKTKDTWQNVLEAFGFKKGRSKYGLDMYYKRGYTASVDNELRNVDLMFEDDVLYRGYSVQGLLSALENQFGKVSFADGGTISKKETQVFGYVKSNGELYYFSSLSRGLDDLMMYEKIDVIQLNDYDGGKDFFLGYGSKSRVNGLTEKKSDGRLFFGKWNKGFVDNENYPKGNMLGRHKIKYADGGNINDFTDNQQMIMNQNVELEHHHEELEDILEDEIPVPAWVVAKMATATQSISDVTHYLDGEKELMEDKDEEDYEDEDEDEDENEIQNKIVVEPINVSAGTKAELSKKFTDDALGNLKGFLNGMEGVELRDDYTFDYNNEQYEIEPIINFDDNGVYNAVFTIFDGDGEEQGEITYSREGGKQKFTANSELFNWNNTKFEDGGFMNGVYADGGNIAIDSLNKNTDLREKMIDYIVSVKANGKRMSDRQYDALEKRISDKSFVQLKKEYDALKGNSSFADGGYFDGTIPSVSSYMSNYADGGEVEKYRTLSFKTKEIAEKNKKNIESYFGERVLNSNIIRGIDERGSDGFFVEYSLKKENYAKGGEIAKAEVFGLKRNIMGTTDIEMKISGMRKAQDFIVYPIGKDDAGSVITIQSDTRIGQLNLVKGVGVMSQSHSNGAYFVHLQMDKLTPFTVSESDLENIKSHIFKTAGSNVGTRGVVSDNSGASRVYKRGGGLPSQSYYGMGTPYERLTEEEKKELRFDNYKFKSARQVWGAWDTGQKQHFIKDHVLNNVKHQDYIKKEGDNVLMKAYRDYDKLPTIIKSELIEHIKQGQYAKGGGVGDNVLGLVKGDIFEVIDTEHTVTGQKFVFLDYEDKYGTIALKAIPYPPMLFKKLNDKDKIVYITDISSDGIKKLSDDKSGEILVRRYKNYIQYNMADGGFMNDIYADGGVTYFNNENQHRLSRPSGSFEKEIFDKVRDMIDADSFVGSFGWRISSGKKAYMADGFLYKLDAYDQNLIKNLRLKQGEKVFRYINRTTAIGGMMPFIKINIEKALLYFPLTNENDEILFETKGVTPLWINLIESIFADGGSVAKDVVIQKSGQGVFTVWNIIDSKSPFSYSTEVFFDSKEEATKFANKKGFNIVTEFENEYADGGFMNDVYADGGSFDKPFDVAYKTKSGRSMVALRIMAKNEEEAKQKLIKQMRSSDSFDKVYLAYPSFEDGGFMNNVYAKGGMVVTSIKDIPNFQERLNQRKISYRGLGMGKLFDDFYKLAGTSGTRIKVDGKEYFITDEEFDTFSRDANGKMIVRFEAPARKADGGFMNDVYAKGGMTLNDGSEYEGYNLKDINGKKIKVGDTVKTTQPSGGVLSPADSKVGVVEKTKDAFGNDALQIKYRKEGTTYDRFILLNGKINEIVEKKGSFAKGGNVDNDGITEIRKDPRGNWRAETFIEDFDGYDWRLTTVKTYSGQLISSAQGGKTMDSGSKGISMFKYAMYEDPHHTLEASRPSRLTEKVVGEQHDKALAKFKKFMETGMFKGGGKISNFDKLSAKVAKQYEGKPVKNQYQEEYGKYYSKEEAQEVGDKVAGKVKAMQTTKNMSGGQTALKKTHSGAETLRKANALAKEIRKEDESWLDAKKRAFAQLKK